MPAVPVTETSTFSASVMVPSPGDKVTAASIVAVAQPLCNRTQALIDGKITVKSGVTFLGNAGCDWTNNGNTTLNGTTAIAACASIVMKANGTITVPSTGSFTCAGKAIVSGRRMRGARVALTATTQTVNVSQGNRFTLVSTGTTRTITLKNTSPNIPDAQETIDFLCHQTGSGGYIFAREDATVIASFVASVTTTVTPCYAEFEYDAGVWRLGSNSGSAWDGIADYRVIPGGGA